LSQCHTVYKEVVLIAKRIWQLIIDAAAGGAPGQCDFYFEESVSVETIPSGARNPCSLKIIIGQDIMEVIDRHSDHDTPPRAIKIKTGAAKYLDRCKKYFVLDKGGRMAL
jgi:hypothetical protein